MSKERELLRRAREVLDELYEYGILEPKEEIKVRDDIRAFLAEPEAESIYQVLITVDPYVAWQDCRKEIYEQVTEYKKRILYTRPETEAETIETLRAENFVLAAGQCTEGGPWGDEGGSQYCKYAASKAEPFGYIWRKHVPEDAGIVEKFFKYLPDAEAYSAANNGGLRTEILSAYPKPSPSRKPMTEREIMEQAKVDGFNAIDTAVFAIGVRWAERMHGIGGDDE